MTAHSKKEVEELTPQEFYHRKRKEIEPTFDPHPELETDYWIAYNVLCKNEGWDPIQTIELVFQYIAWQISKQGENYPLKRGYPNVVRMTDGKLAQAAWNTLQNTESQFKFQPKAERQLENQIMLIKRWALATKKPLAELVEKNAYLPIWPLLRVVLSPTLRKHKFTVEQQRKVLFHAVDPNTWNAFKKIGISPKDIQETKELTGTFQRNIRKIEAGKSH